MANWKRLYKRNEDGCSLITFYKNVKEYDTTVLVVKDTNGWVFGGFCTEPWKQFYTFYGCGENMLFSFEDVEEPLVYQWTGVGDQHMYGSEKAVGMGGSLKAGRFGLYLRDDFKTGSTFETEMFSNDPLSKDSEFTVDELEVWAVDE